MSAARHSYYPGFLAALFLVLLRIAIGWHFLYEGVEKIYSTQEGRGTFLSRILPPPPPPAPMDTPAPTFSAEGYLRASSGPFAPYFRGLVPDVDGRKTLDLDRLKARWNADLERFASHYELTEAQRADAEKELASRVTIAEDQFRDLEFSQKVRKYFDGLEHFLAIERNPDALASERTQAYKDRTRLDADRRELVAIVDGWTETLHDAWQNLLTPEQASQLKPLPPWNQLDWINTLTMVGLTTVGLCLLLGLFTPLAALGGAGYLLMFYLSMPPWPGLPGNPMAEGHYLFVNKNLIEMIACLALAALPTAHWVGLDALLFGWRRRRRAAAAELAEAENARGTVVEVR